MEPRLRYRAEPYRPPKLAPHEINVCIELRSGRRNAEIAKRLHMTRGSLKTIMGNIYRKYGVNDRTALALRIVDDPRSAPDCDVFPGAD